MVDIYAVCISVSQSYDGPRVIAHLNCQTEDRGLEARLEWRLPHAINANGNPGEWLYSVLSRLVQDFDEHTVTQASVNGVEGMRESIRG